MTPEQLSWLASDSGQSALAQAAENDPQRLALNAHKQPGQHLSELAEQLQLRSQFYHKFGEWTQHLLLTRRAAEQAASYATAHWKSMHLGVGRTQVIDICAGLGIDALAHAQAGRNVQAIELDPTRAQLLRHNSALLDIPLTVIEGDGLAHLDNISEHTLVCADPDRRASGGRSLRASDWEPNPLEIAHNIPDQAGCLLKLPPGCDWKMLQRDLPGHWRAIVLSVRSECKEILLERMYSPEQMQTVAAVLDQHGRERFRWDGAISVKPAQCSDDIGPFFIDPDPAIIRSGYVAEVFSHYHLKLVHPQVAFGHGEDPGRHFPGHRYQVIASGAWDLKILKSVLKKEQIKKIRVSRRHFPYDPPAIFKQLKIKEGGNTHLCCFRNGENKLIWILGKLFL